MSTGSRNQSDGRPLNLSPLSNTDSGIISEDSRTPFFQLKSNKEIAVLRKIAKIISKPLTKTDLQDKGVVYVLKVEETDHVKVGYSRIADLVRVGEVGYGCGLKLRRIYQHMPVHGAYRAELIIHNLLSDFRRTRMNCPCGTAKEEGHREWYQKSFVETIGMVQLVCNWMQKQDPYNLQDEQSGKLDGIWKEAICLWIETPNHLSPRHWSEFFLSTRESLTSPITIPERRAWVRGESRRRIMSGVFDVNALPPNEAGIGGSSLRPRTTDMSTKIAKTTTLGLFSRFDVSTNERSDRKGKKRIIEHDSTDDDDDDDDTNYDNTNETDDEETADNSILASAPADKKHSSKHVHLKESDIAEPASSSKNHTEVNEASNTQSDNIIEEINRLKLEVASLRENAGSRPLAVDVQNTSIPEDQIIQQTEQKLPSAAAAAVHFEESVGGDQASVASRTPARMLERLSAQFFSSRKNYNKFKRGPV